MIEAAHPGGEPPQTIEAHAAFARMNGLPQRLRLQEIHLLEVARAGQPRRAARGPIGTDGANLPGQPDLHDVTGFRAFDQAQNPLGHQAPHRQAHGPGRQAVAARKPKNRKAQPQPVFQPAMPQKMGIDQRAPMRVRHSRGTRTSSICFQMRTTLVLLIFMILIQ